MMQQGSAGKEVTKAVSKLLKVETYIFNRIC
jgi:hypothetical protein